MSKHERGVWYGKVLGHNPDGKAVVRLDGDKFNQWEFIEGAKAGDRVRCSRTAESGADAWKWEVVVNGGSDQ